MLNISPDKSSSSISFQFFFIFFFVLLTLNNPHTVLLTAVIGPTFLSEKKNNPYENCRPCVLWIIQSHWDKRDVTDDSFLILFFINIRTLSGVGAQKTRTKKSDLSAVLCTTRFFKICLFVCLILERVFLQCSKSDTGLYYQCPGGTSCLKHGRTPEGDTMRRFNLQRLSSPTMRMSLSHLIWTEKVCAFDSNILW